MKTTNKDRYEHKLHCFLKELDNSDDRKAVYKKYGFTDVDFERAIGLTLSESERNHYVDGVGYKKATKMLRDKILLASEHRDSLAPEV